MKRKYILVFIIATVFGIFVDKLIFTNKENDFKTNINTKKSVSNLSMMLETGASTGEYELTTRSEWPTSGYLFNSELSKCENGSSLTWDNKEKKVIMSSSVSDKCYVYFDVALNYSITYEDIGGAYAYITGPYSFASGETVSITVVEENVECSIEPIISIPTSVTDLNCTVNSNPVGAPDDWYRNVTISNQSIYLTLNTNSTCTFTMPNENITFGANQVLSGCLK